MIYPRENAGEGDRIYKDIMYAINWSLELHELIIFWDWNRSFDEFSALIDVVSQIKMLGSLSISYLRVGPSEAELIKQLIVETDSLYAIRLYEVELNDDDAWITILKGLPANKTLGEFTLYVSNVKRSLEPQALHSQISPLLKQSKFAYVHYGYQTILAQHIDKHQWLVRIPTLIEPADQINNAKLCELNHSNGTEIWRVLRCCRILAGSRLKLGFIEVFPAEIYVLICGKLAWSFTKNVLSLITRCALDRGTVGKLYTIRFKFSLIKLAFLCRRVMAGL